MTKIAILSDTHGYIDDKVVTLLKEQDEVWHAGDFGENDVIGVLEKIKPLRGVYGNIDAVTIRDKYPEQLVFTCEGVKVMMRHIGGYPPKYTTDTKKQLLLHQPRLFISGHSHILKVMYDEKIGCLHINPGAAGKQGWHKMRTLITLEINGANMQNCNVIELGKR